jgi:cAMP phosphodiesterase
MQTAFLDSDGSKQVPSMTAKRDDPRAVVLDTLEVLDSKKPLAIVGSA